MKDLYGIYYEAAARIVYEIIFKKAQNHVSPSKYETMSEALLQEELDPSGTMETDDKVYERAYKTGENFTSASELLILCFHHAAHN